MNPRLCSNIAMVPFEKYWFSALFTRQYYEWAAGTQRGSNDIFDWQRTKSQSSSEMLLDFSLGLGEVRNIQSPGLG